MASFEDGVYYGVLSRSKNLAKSMCAAAIVDKLLNDGRIEPGKKSRNAKKRAANEQESENNKVFFKASYFSFIF